MVQIKKHSSKNAARTIARNVTAKCKKAETNRQFAIKKDNNKMHSQRTKQHICKHLHTSRFFSFQKSCFFADALNNIIILEILRNRY